jgi:cellulose synthase/poly-beta-1,6-N-acetylglucosamine synthase-like glycosyltransferase
MEVVFWISVCVLFYAYLGYGLLLTLLRFVSPKQPLPQKETRLPVTLIIPAYNEEAFLEKKIQNCLSLTYPRHLLTILFVTDGSTDTTAMLADHPSLLHLHAPERRGKSAALNRAMQKVETPFVVFSDANTLLHPDSIQNLLRHYEKPTVGGVSGEKRIAAADDTAVSTGERMYWQYESVLKRADADFYTVIGAAGELFSIRTELFQPLDETVILDDFVLSALICLKGYRIAYDYDAFAVEGASESFTEEKQRKIRISAGCFQALVLLKGLLNPFKNWRLTFQYISHKVLRWTVCPVLAPVLFLINAVLVFTNAASIYQLFFFLQCIFYGFALLGWALLAKKGYPRALLVPYYYVFMNLSLYIGFFRFFSGRQSVMWQKAIRKPYP